MPNFVDALVAQRLQLIRIESTSSEERMICRDLGQINEERLSNIEAWPGPSLIVKVNL